MTTNLMKFAIFFTVLLCLIFIKSNCQLKFDTTYVKAIPFKESYMLFVKNNELRKGLPANGVSFFSNSDSAYSLLDGIVEKVILIDGYYGLSVKSDNGINIIYYGFSKVFKKEGELINRSVALGLASSNKTPKDYYLHVNIQKNKRSMSNKLQFAMLCSLTE